MGKWRAAASPQLEEDDQEGCRAASPASLRRSIGAASATACMDHVLATSPYDHYACIVTILRLDLWRRSGRAR